MANEERQLSNAKEVLRQYAGIRLGIPALPPEKARTYRFGWEQIAVPYNPHVFFVQQLDLWRNGHRYESLNNVMVMSAHGLVSFENNRENWRFTGTNRSIYETVGMYENFARDFSLPSVDVVIACRGERPSESPPSVIRVTRRPAILVQPSSMVPHIFPESFVQTVSQWLKREVGVENLTPDATGWQGIDYWRRWWEEHSAQRMRTPTPKWALEAAIY